jgi:hypothetical protein
MYQIAMEVIDGNLARDEDIAASNFVAVAALVTVVVVVLQAYISFDEGLNMFPIYELRCR